MPGNGGDDQVNGGSESIGFGQSETWDEEVSTQESSRGCANGVNSIETPYLRTGFIAGEVAAHERKGPAHEDCRWYQ